MHLADKGHTDLLEAAALLAARGRRIEWLLAGTGALFSAIEARARALGLDGQVRLLGRRTDVPSLLRQVDLVVHPSWAEGFPNVVLEAMCAARPVVATRVGGCVDLVDDDSGRLVEPHQPHALADAIDALLSDPAALRALGASGRRVVERRFSLERMSVTVEALYTRLLAGARPISISA
jgi:glycosyltransferase involved in cell wall biosynthesis